MTRLELDYKNEVAEALIKARDNFSGSDAVFARQYGVSSSIFSRIKKGERENILSDVQWLSIGSRMDVSINKRKWNIARTTVLKRIEEEVVFCKTYSKSMIFCDEAEIGKTVASKHLSLSLKNCFRVDGSQCKTTSLFIKELAKVIGVDITGTMTEIDRNIKTYLRAIERPIVLIDDAGYLEIKTFMKIIEYWNSTENIAGWYLLGDDTLKAKLLWHIEKKHVGFKALLSRLSGNFSNIVPSDKAEKQAFYRQLITDVISVNVEDKAIVPSIVKRCLIQRDGSVGGLRRAESLLILNS
ncbi:MAG: ATP-binding protein [Candidatus Gastranaerophilales bacterium]|nr:ATP-binding protein [Candidatus Gastranaerophilales bacterium]